MEIVLAIVAVLWMITVLVVCAMISKLFTNININVKHGREPNVTDFPDLYDSAGDVKKEHMPEDNTIDFNEVFKDLNEFMTGDDEVKSDG